MARARPVSIVKIGADLPHPRHPRSFHRAM
jgi:hypothetical protein